MAFRWNKGPCLTRDPSGYPRLRFRTLANNPRLCVIMGGLVGSWDQRPSPRHSWLELGGMLALGYKCSSTSTDGEDTCLAGEKRKEKSGVWQLAGRSDQITGSKLRTLSYGLLLPSIEAHREPASPW